MGTTTGDTEAHSKLMAEDKRRSGRIVIYCGEVLGPDPQKKKLRPSSPLPLRRIHKGFSANYKQTQKRPEMRRLKS